MDNDHAHKTKRNKKSAKRKISRKLLKIKEQKLIKNTNKNKAKENN